MDPLNAVVARVRPRPTSDAHRSQRRRLTTSAGVLTAQDSPLRSESHHSPRHVLSWTPLRPSPELNRDLNLPDVLLGVPVVPDQPRKTRTGLFVGERWQWDPHAEAIVVDAGLQLGKEVVGVIEQPKDVSYRDARPDKLGVAIPRSADAGDALDGFCFGADKVPDDRRNRVCAGHGNPVQRVVVETIELITELLVELAEKRKDNGGDAGVGWGGGNRHSLYSAPPCRVD
jgi:hypothetical protein